MTTKNRTAPKIELHNLLFLAQNAEGVVVTYHKNEFFNTINSLAIICSFCSCRPLFFLFILEIGTVWGT